MRYYTSERQDEIMLEDRDHHEYCPMFSPKGRFPCLNTLCICHELRKADRAAAAEDRADDERKYGGI